MKFSKLERMLFSPEPEATGGGSTLTNGAGNEPSNGNDPDTSGDNSGTSGSVEPNWLDGVDSELLDHNSMKSILDINGLVKSYVHGQKMVGANKIAVPDEHATDDDWNEVFGKLGRPDRDKYDVEFGEAGFDDTFKNGFLDAAHTANLLPHQAKAMFDYWNDQIDTATSADNEASAAKTQAEMEALKTEWGNGYEKNLVTAQQAVNTLVDDQFKAFLDESGLGNNPNMIRLFNSIGAKLNEDTFDRDTVKHLGMTKEEAQEKANNIMGDPTHAYWNKTHANHKKAVADMLEYNTTIYAEQK